MFSFIFAGCNARHFFDMIEGAWGEQSDDDVADPSADTAPPSAKKSRTTSPSPATAGPPSRYIVQPGEAAKAGIPTGSLPSFELQDSDKKSYYCVLCDYSNRNHDSALTHVRRSHLQMALGCLYCSFSSPSYKTYKEHVEGKHAGFPLTASAGPSRLQEAKATTSAIEGVLPME